MIEQVKHLLDKLNHGETSSETYENLLSTYQNQVNLVETRISQLENDQKIEQENTINAIENWASNRMSDITNLEALRPTSIEAAKLVLDELTTSKLEVEANLENYPDNSLLKRLQETIVEEIAFLQQCVSDWEEALYTLTKIENWINTYANEEILAGQSDLDIKRRLPKRRLLLQEIEERQKLCYNSLKPSSNFLSQAKSAKDNREIGEGPDFLGLFWAKAS